ncbi:hypothetical protein FC52_GL001594 [Lactobacillus pasteurii DSM 23907 = CRBIP 24.76]|uniref:Bacteriocin immunity protein n=1 Tax=Lactobacillus pasteurii DSM 23907 = CRBIP 24.76 TaxID=1423790 RepID=I7IYT6_9LACO|nr:bacteriocin immunity protein [Lactobacillus pasteurii]KRK07704.1 hypothetical protein FC52_GL001594 [Lactobacillus pasteurii DSM 23907 = CRBIP 24.76]TDG77713.1 hypothetical protein C5L33_000124 [Lactobacillus pasteurii]CCI84712.1 Putative uncharacterized protein [Lactobacillus pasteurii DSM 23907 = CRBIP 24.76]
MFGRKRKIETEKIILTDIDQILQDTTIKAEERDALIRVKNRLEKGQYMQRVLNDFLAQVRSLALKSQLSPSVRKFYLNIINDAYPGTAWSGMMFM